MKIRNCSFEEILYIHSRIPEFKTISDIEYFTRRIGTNKYLSLAAEISNELVGYKLGYWLDSTRFYSWLGGVIPSQRRQGVAEVLLRYQEGDVCVAGGKTILVKSMNKYRGMLIMLISNGYQIVGFENQGVNEGKVQFSKSFT
ncbi:GNAT family N-acetyltransferase [Thermodesulfobacteriota bacterium]